MEAHVEALLGEPAEEVEDRVGIVARRGPQPQRAAVAEDHVDDVRHQGILLRGDASASRHDSVPPRRPSPHPGPDEVAWAVLHGADPADR